MPAALAGPMFEAAATVAAGNAAAGLVSGPVAALYEGVLYAMFLTKLKMVAAMLLTAALFICSLKTSTIAGSSGIELVPVAGFDFVTTGVTTAPPFGTCGPVENWVVANVLPPLPTTAQPPAPPAVQAPPAPLSTDLFAVDSPTAGMAVAHTSHT